MAKISAFGVKLREHRQKRSLSQLSLANLAGTTSRYVSFIETGRSRPGQNVILRIAEALNLTLRESNTLLNLAGLPMAFNEYDFDAKEMQSHKRVIDQILKKHNPFPAWVIGPGLKFLASNEGAEKIFPGLVGMEPIDIVDMWCGPEIHADEQQRAYVVFNTLRGLRQEALHYPHPEVNKILKRVEQYAAQFKEPLLFNEVSVMCPTLVVNGQPIETLTTVMRFDKVLDVIMSELRIELVFPADEESEAILRSL